MRFSARTFHRDEPNALTNAVARARAEGRKLVDLTASNPTTVGLPYEPVTLDDPRSATYEPLAFGLPAARAVAASTLGIAPERCALTASTSEAYGILFTMLCDAGEAVLVPAPSYPLLSFLATFHDVELVPYPLVFAGAWHVDLDGIRRAMDDSPSPVRAIVTVSPNNPTGSYLGEGELEAMLALDVPVVSDEVFARYPIADHVPEGRLETVAHADRGLVFALSGLSKLAALPQMKLGWIGVGGAPSLVDKAMARLELVLDTYLSVGTPVQHALPKLLAAAETTRDAIRARVRTNLATLKAALPPIATVLPVEGGWYAIVRVPDTTSDEAWAITLATRYDVHVHPGYFFDMTRGAFLVVSLLAPEAELREGAARIAACLEAAQ